MDKQNTQYYRITFLFLLSLMLLLMYESYIYSLFDKFVLPILRINKSDLLLLFFGVLGIICSFYLVYKVVRGFRLSFFHIAVHLFTLLIYGYLRYRAYTTGIYKFYPDNHTIGYIDIIFIVVAISLLASVAAYVIDRLKRKNKKSKIVKVFELIPDSPLTHPKEDVLGYADFSEGIAKRLEGIPKDTPCSLGLIAEWGVGKSTIINFIEHYLNKEKRYIIIRFNPRHSYNSARIQEDFYSFLSSELKQYNSIFSTIFIDYMKGAGIIGKNNTIQIILNMYKVWNKEGESSRINQAIDNLNKRIVVIIEDLDRLLAEEIIEVFKIIDNYFITKNIIFISAYDKEHLNKIVDTKYITQDSKFSDKFFSWEVHVPLISHTKIIHFINTQLETKLPKESSYTSVVNKHRFILQSYIKTIRDAKRFLNSFIKLFIEKKDVVNFEDYMLLSLMKYKYQSEYYKLFNKNYICEDTINNPNRYILKKELENNIYSVALLEILFRESRNIDYLSINNKSSFYSYFYYHTDRVEIDKLRSLFDLNTTTIQAQLNTWANENKIQQVLEYFNEINILTLSDKNAIYNYIDILLFILVKFNIDIRLYIRPFFLKSECNEVCSKYQIKKSEFKDSITEKLKGNVGMYPYRLLRDLIINIIDQGEKDFFFTKKEIQDIAKFHVQNYIDNKPIIKEDLEIELLYENIETIELPERLIILNKEVCSQIKQYVKQHPNFYIKNFVRNGLTSYSIDWFMLACEPFWKQLFDVISEFEQFIENTSLDNIVEIQLVRNFWKIYRLNDYQPIEFHNVNSTYEEAISDNLQSMADKAIQIEKHAKTIEKIYSNDQISKNEKVRRLKDVSKEMEKVELYIRKRREVLVTINQYVTKLSREIGM